MAKEGNAVLERQYLGDEPTFKQDQELSKLDLIKALNWYNATKDAKQAKKYLLSSLKEAGVDKKIISAFSDISDSDCMTVGYLSRMITRGALLSQADRDTFDFALTGLIAAAEVINESNKPSDDNKEAEAPVVSIQDRIKAQAQRVISELEVALDNKEFKVNVKEMFVNGGVKGPQGKHILTWVESRIKEFSSVQKTKDEQLKEGYSNYSKGDLKNVLKWLESVKESLEQIVALVKAGRKPRAKKVKSATQLVEKVNYLKSDSKLKVTSIDPSQIIGVSQLWVFNVKTRKLGVFNAADGQGLMVKGTTVKNFDESKSFAKTVRKPEVKIPELMGAGKVALRHFMDSIKAKESTLKGRLNGEVLLLKVVK